MKKNVVYMLSVTFFFASVIFIIYNLIQHMKRDAIVPLQLKERTGDLSKGREWENTRKMAEYYTAAVKKDPLNIKALISLASIFVQEGRITGDHQYYDVAALHCADKVLEYDSTDFDALTIKALIYLSEHHFSDAIAVAEKAQKINPYNAFVYGILVDGNVEMGNYSVAVENSDRMVSIRPDIRSYSRISYLREIHGDYDGAIEAMKLAVEAGAPGDEPTEWARVHLGQLYEHINDIPSAEMNYQVSLEERPGYAYALAGMARIAGKKKDYSNAISLLENAQKTMNNNLFSEDLIKLFKESGQNNKASTLAIQNIRTLEAENRKAARDGGHYADKELAMAYLDVKDYDKALTHALIEYNRRPLNIEVNETVAWVYYNRGEYQKAVPYIHAALKTKCKDPELLNRAALIFKEAGMVNNSGI